EQANAESTKALERYRLLSEATNDAIWEFDAVLGKLTCNEAARSYFENPNEPPADPMSWWRSRIHPDERQRIRDSVQAVIALRGAFWSEEYRLQRPDGSFAHVHGRACFAYDTS